MTTPYTLFTPPLGDPVWIPADVRLAVPEKAAVDAGRLHTLIYLPWDDKYIELVEPAYRAFFRAVLSYLHARSTDVHVASCLPFMKELIQAEREPVDEQVAHVAFILHDSGWSQMSAAEIAASLDVDGLALSATATVPKLRHAQLGQELAQRVLAEYAFQPTLTDAQKELIYLAILYHDRPAELSALGSIPASVRVVCNTDHLWSFTHQNFWQDTVRKGVDPRAYWKNLGNDLDSYFVSEPGRRKARQLLAERAAELKTWEEWVTLH